jgi:hypothetical protein
VLQPEPDLSSFLKRENKFQLRVTHRFMSKPFFHAFEDKVEANNYVATRRRTAGLWNRPI